MPPFQQVWIVLLNKIVLPEVPAFTRIPAGAFSGGSALSRQKSSPERVISTANGQLDPKSAANGVEIVMATPPANASNQAGAEVVSISLHVANIDESSKAQSKISTKPLVPPLKLTDVPSSSARAEEPDQSSPRGQIKPASKPSLVPKPPASYKQKPSVRPEPKRSNGGAVQVSGNDLTPKQSSAAQSEAPYSLASNKDQGKKEPTSPRHQLGIAPSAVTRAPRPGRKPQQKLDIKTSRQNLPSKASPIVSLSATRYKSESITNRVVIPPEISIYSTALVDQVLENIVAEYLSSMVSMVSAQEV